MQMLCNIHLTTSRHLPTYYLFSQPTPEPTKSPLPQGVTLSPTLSPVPPEVTTTCLLITTGTGQYDGGFIDVFVDSGAGYVEVTTPSIKYAQGQVVLDVCYSGLVGVQVTNSETNAWAGSIETSVNNKASPYSAMECINCTGDVSTTEYIVVDGDGNGQGQTECLNGIGGNVCTLVNVATGQPTPEVSQIVSIHLRFRIAACTFNISHSLPLHVNLNSPLQRQPSLHCLKE